MADSGDDTTEGLASPLPRTAPLQPRAANVEGAIFGDYANIHQGDQNVHVGQLNHVVNNNYACPPPRSESNATFDSHDDHPKTPCWTVPFGRNKDFVGRGSILDQLLNMIPPTADGDDCQQTVISGLGGVGKTQVALEAAFRVRGKHRDCHVFWVPAIDATSFENAYRKIGQELKMPGINDHAADIKLLVKAALSQSAYKWLLIIDNADNVALFTNSTDATSLRDYLPFNLNGSILFTTRNDEVGQKLDIRGENIIHLNEMNRTEAIDMLQKGLSAHQLSNAQSIASLLDFLTDLPLAVKQASAYMIRTGMVVSQYLEYCRLSNDHLIAMLSKDFDARARYKTTQNPVATTWLISFRAVAQDNPLAAKYLQFMSFLAEKDIPKHLLPPSDDELKAYEAIGTLKAYAFISERADKSTYDMHRLVRIAMLNWLRNEGELQKRITEVIQRLDTLFPLPSSWNKDVWARYIPHTTMALKFQKHSLDQISGSRVLFKAARSLFYLGKLADAKQMNQQALELQISALGREHPDTLATMDCHVMITFGEGQYEESERIGRKVLDLQIEVLGVNHPDTLRSMNMLSVAVHEQGQYKEAEQICRRALELRKKVLGVTHPDTLASMNNLSVDLRKQGQYKEAEQIAREVLELHIEALGIEHPNTLRSMSNLSIVLRDQRQYKEAEQICRKVLELRIKVIGIMHSDTLANMNNLSVDLRKQGQYKEAEQVARKVLELQTKALGVEHPCTLKSMSHLSTVLRDQGQYKEAEQMRLQAQQLRMKLK
ncbi:P-loop containing nucleoside triphosphate hydrolase protein [Trichoderma barbatum]